MDEQPRWQPTNAQLTVAASIAVLATAGVFYHLTHHTSWSQTALFYLGLPAILAIGLVLTRPARSITGTIMKVLTVGLLLSPLVLREGVLCVLLAAPLFYLVGAGVGLIADALRDRDGRVTRRSALALAPLALLLSEGVTPATTLDGAERVVAVRTVAASPGEVRDALAATPCFHAVPRPWTLDQFPRLDSVSGSGLRPGDRRAMSFTGPHGTGTLVLTVAATGPGRVTFTVASDTSPMAHWWSLYTAEVRWAAAGPDRTAVSWTLKYVRLLAPAAYFGPIERVAAREAAAYLIDAVATPHDC